MCLESSEMHARLGKYLIFTILLAILCLWFNSWVGKPIIVLNAPRISSVTAKHLKQSVYRMKPNVNVGNRTRFWDAMRGSRQQHSRNRTQRVKIIKTRFDSESNKTGVEQTSFKLSTLPPKLKGENVVSMSLYGSSPRYTTGAIRNAELVKVNFPGWRLRIYTETPSDQAGYDAVPQTVLDRLRALGAEIRYIDPHVSIVSKHITRPTGRLKQVCQIAALQTASTK